MKKLFYLILVFITCSSYVFAQLDESSTVYSTYKLGFHVGGMLLQGDIPASGFRPATRVSLDRHISPFSTVGLEAQLGQFEEGDTTRSDKWHSGLHAKGTYYSVSVNGRMKLGQLIRANKGALKVIRQVYVGLGVGYAGSSIFDIVRKGYAGKDGGGGLCVPTNIGLDLPILRTETGMSKLILSINYQYVFTMTDDFDAFNFESYSSGANDGYSLASVGLRVAIGKVKFKH